MTDLLEVGRVARSHGLRGDVLISFTTDQIDERTAAGAQLVVAQRVYAVTSARPHQKYQLVSLDGVSDRDAADRLRGQLVFAEPLDDVDTVFVHEVIGLRLVDQHGVDHGEVVSVLDNPASDLMELDDGRLVPFVFLVTVGDEVVAVDVPAGLLDGEPEAAG